MKRPPTADEGHGRLTQAPRAFLEKHWDNRGTKCDIVKCSLPPRQPLLKSINTGAVSEPKVIITFALGHLYISIVGSTSGIRQRV